MSPEKVMLPICKALGHYNKIAKKKGFALFVALLYSLQTNFGVKYKHSTKRLTTGLIFKLHTSYKGNCVNLMN